MWIFVMCSLTGLVLFFLVSISVQLIRMEKALADVSVDVEAKLKKQYG